VVYQTIWRAISEQDINESRHKNPKRKGGNEKQRKYMEDKEVSMYTIQ